MVISINNEIFGNASTVSMDVNRLMNIIKKSGYRGYLPVETRKMKDTPYDPFMLVPAFMKELKAAMD
jgi:hypothetical protein